MKIKCNICLEFDSEEKVKNILKSIEVDNFDFVKSKVKGKTLESEIQGNSVSSLIHTLDDFLACISVAEKIMDKN